MGRRTGEISLVRASQILGVHAVTVRRWCRGEVASKVEHVRRDVAGRYWLDSAEVRALADAADKF